MVGSAYWRNKMITIIWKCDICGKEKITSRRFAGYRIDERAVYSPTGWQAFAKKRQLLCLQCYKKEKENYYKKHPNTVAIA
jgi:hypothetical protein